MTDAEASALWGNNKTAQHCEFYETSWNARDDGDYSADFSPQELLDLGITEEYKGGFYGTDGFLGAIDGSGDEVFTSPSEIINGQRIIIYDSETKQVLDSVNFDIKKSSFWNWNFNVLTLFFSFLFFGLLIYQYMKKRKSC